MTRGEQKSLTGNLLKRRLYMYQLSTSELHEKINTVLVTVHSIFNLINHVHILALS